MSNLHTELYPALADITTKIHEVDVELGEALAHFATQVSPKLTAEERADLATILQLAFSVHPGSDGSDSAKHRVPDASGFPTETSAPQSALHTL